MIRVVLLRGIPEHVGPSVRQLADALETGFAGRSDIGLTALPLPELGWGERIGRGRRPRVLVGLENVFDSFVRYPTVIRRATRGDDEVLFHIIDQWYGHLAAFLPPERTIVSCQDLILAKYSELPTGHRPTRRDRARYAASVRPLHTVAHVVCSTEAVKADLIRLRRVPPARISVVPKGVSPDMRPLPAGSGLRRELGLPTGPIVLHVSTGWPYKNVAGTLRVLAALRERGVAARLVRVGKRMSAHERALAGTLGMTRWIDDLGTVAPERLIELYNLADVLLFPSIDEGFGRPPVEAMACGTPVVTSTAPALVEVVGDAGLHAPASDIPRLTDAVEAIIRDPDLASGLRRRGLERARRYGWETTVAGYAAVYEQVAG